MDHNRSIIQAAGGGKPRNPLLLGAETHWPIGEESNGHVDSRGPTGYCVDSDWLSKGNSFWDRAFKHM